MGEKIFDRKYVVVGTLKNTFYFISENYPLIIKLYIKYNGYRTVGSTINITFEFLLLNLILLYAAYAGIIFFWNKKLFRFIKKNITYHNLKLSAMFWNNCSVCYGICVLCTVSEFEGGSLRLAKRHPSTWAFGI